MLQFGWFPSVHNMDFQHRKLLQIPMICKHSCETSNFPSYSVTAFLVVCFCVIFSKLHKRSRNRSQEPPRQINDETLDKVPVQEYGVVFKYKRDDGLIEGTECSVCLSEFQEDETLRLLPECSHAFHTPCIDTWLRSQRNCPNCRASLVKNIARSSSSSSSSSSSTTETTMTTSLGANVDSFGASKDTRLRVPEQESSGAQGRC